MNTNILCIIACHSNDELKKETLKNNIKYFKEISSKIVIVASSEYQLDLKYLKEDDFEIEILYVLNDSDLCYKKYFFWYMSQNLEILFNTYTDIILTNDSFIISRSILEFKNLFLPNIQMTSFLASSILTYHFTDFLRRYNKEGLIKIMSVIKRHINKNMSYFELIVNIEINSMVEFSHSEINVLYPVEFENVNIHFEDDILYVYLYKKNYPILKIKKLFNCPMINNYILYHPNLEWLKKYIT